jgi:hypothetical protein
VNWQRRGELWLCRIADTPSRRELLKRFNLDPILLVVLIVAAHRDVAKNLNLPKSPYQLKSPLLCLPCFCKPEKALTPRGYSKFCPTSRKSEEAPLRTRAVDKVSLDFRSLNLKREPADTVVANLHLTRQNR